MDKIETQMDKLCIKRKEYGIKMAKDYFRFSSAHFLCSECTIECLHGHNYSVCMSLKGEKLTNGLIVDFRDIK
jgi:6-pyruvoyl-tetrahydropterin synthase